MTSHFLSGFADELIKVAVGRRTMKRALKQISRGDVSPARLAKSQGRAAGRKANADNYPVSDIFPRGQGKRRNQREASNHRLEKAIHKERKKEGKYPGRRDIYDDNYSFEAQRARGTKLRWMTDAARKRDLAK